MRSLCALRNWIFTKKGSKLWLLEGVRSAFGSPGFQLLTDDSPRLVGVEGSYFFVEGPFRGFAGVNTRKCSRGCRIQTSVTKKDMWFLEGVG